VQNPCCRKGLRSLQVYGGEAPLGRYVEVSTPDPRIDKCHGYHMLLVRQICVQTYPKILGTAAIKIKENASRISHLSSLQKMQLLKKTL